MRSSLMMCLSALLVAGCEPNVDEDAEEDDAWMIGTWSSPGAGGAADHVTHWRIEPGGMMTSILVSDCGAIEKVPDEYRWHRVATDRIEVTELDGAPMDDSRNPTIYALRDVCDGPGSNEGLSSVHVRDGEEVLGEGYIRGRVCLEEQQRPDGDVVEWDSCLSVWCEGEPPATLPCLP